MYCGEDASHHSFIRTLSRIYLRMLRLSASLHSLHLSVNELALTKNYFLLDKYVASSSTDPFVVTGDAGVGKVRRVMMARNYLLLTLSLLCWRIGSFDSRNTILKVFRDKLLFSFHFHFLYLTLLIRHCVFAFHWLLYRFYNAH
jgi:hypothetical protein